MNSGHRKFQKFCVLFCFNCLLNSRKGLRCNPLSISSAGFHNICFNLYIQISLSAGWHFSTRTLLTVGHTVSAAECCTLCLVTRGGWGHWTTGDHWGHVPVFPLSRCPRDWCGTTGSVQDTCTGTPPVHGSCTCTTTQQHWLRWSSWCHDHPPPAPPPHQI